MIALFIALGVFALAFLAIAACLFSKDPQEDQSGDNAPATPLGRGTSSDDDHGDA